MTGNEYQRLAGQTLNRDLTPYGWQCHALHGMVAELGEVHSLYQKTFNGHSIEEEHLKKEVGDLLWFIAEFCTSQNWDLEDVMKLNIDKVTARYPNGFDVERSLHRQVGDI